MIPTCSVPDHPNVLRLRWRGDADRTGPSSICPCPQVGPRRSCSPSPTAPGPFPGPPSAAAGPPVPPPEDRAAEPQCRAGTSWTDAGRTHALVEHVGFMPQRRVLTQMLLDPLDPLHLQLLQLLKGRKQKHPAVTLTPAAVAMVTG